LENRHAHNHEIDLDVFGSGTAADARRAGAAVLLAQRLGFALQTNRTLTEVEATRLLMENNISPFGGWNVDEPILENDLARILVQALGVEGEIPEEERSNPETTAYADLLLRKYDVVVTGVEVPAGLLDENPGTDVEGTAGKLVSTVPLIGDELGGEPGQITTTVMDSNFLPGTESGFQQILNQVTPSPGGGATGQTSDQAQDTTPSTP
jgi:hypothetical protein